MEKLEELVVSIVTNFVYEPGEVETYVTDDEHNGEEVKTIHVKVDPKDVGICIGKGGENAEALRRVISLCGVKIDQKVFVKIDAPKKDRELPPNHFNV